MYTVGVDLGKRKSQYAVLDAEGKVFAECSLPNRSEVVQKFLRGLPGAAQVGCETCLNSYWLVARTTSLDFSFEGPGEFFQASAQGAISSRFRPQVPRRERYRPRGAAVPPRDLRRPQSRVQSLRVQVESLPPPARNSRGPRTGCIALNFMDRINK